MSSSHGRIGVGTRFQYDRDAVEVVEMSATAAGNEVILRNDRGQVLRLALKELLFSDQAQLIPEQSGPTATYVERITSVCTAGWPPRPAAKDRRVGPGRDKTGNRDQTALCRLTANRWPASHFSAALPASENRHVTASGWAKCPVRQLHRLGQPPSNSVPGPSQNAVRRLDTLKESTQEYTCVRNSLIKTID
ncbi:hypothetical protein ACOKM5_43180 [Streptomyces sp. BH097]|uniref:hypothetical protein n=1 Tax=unclassified Streptomyces TaxID=2593676 RepID=UPI003BB535C4